MVSRRARVHGPQQTLRANPLHLQTIQPAVGANMFCEVRTKSISAATCTVLLLLSRNTKLGRLLLASYRTS